MTDIMIQLETTADIDAIDHIERAAFAQPGEANLIKQLRANKTLVLSLVAFVDEIPVGHIAFSPMTFENPVENIQVLALAPVAVLPKYQRQGIGGALIREGIQRLTVQGYDLIFLIGHPDYYPRFGFIPAVAQGFDCAYTTPGEANLHFMVRELSPNALTSASGLIHYCPEFASL